MTSPSFNLLDEEFEESKMPSFKLVDEDIDEDKICGTNLCILPYSSYLFYFRVLMH